MSIENRITDIENSVARLYEERRILNDQVMLISRRIREHEDQLTDLEAKRDGVM